MNTHELKTWPLFYAALLMLAGCDGTATLSYADNKAAKACIDAGMNLRIEYAVIPEKVWRVSCVPQADQGVEQ